MAPRARRDCAGNRAEAPPRVSAKESQDGAETVPSTHLHLPEGSLSLATLLAMARGRRLPHRWILGAPLAKSEALILLLASLRQGKLATLTPRLDRGSLEKLAKKNGAEVLPTAPSSETEASASSAGSG